jgi:hypothetical protein
MVARSVHWTDEQKAEVRLRLARGELPREIGPAVGVCPRTVRLVRRQMLAELATAGQAQPGAAPEPAKPAPTPHEIRDAAFWRRRHAEAQDALHRTERLLKQVSGLLDRPVQPPAWTIPAKDTAKNRAAGLLQISDPHGGEVVRPEEVGGLNAYNPDVMVRRLRRLFSASVEILPRWAADCRLEGVVVAVNGDLVSGDIHDELRRTNALTAHESAYLVADELTAGLRILAEAFGAVLAVFTPGNHGRTTERTHAKRTSALSYDMLVGEMVRRAFEGDKRVTVSLATGVEAVYPVLGWTVHQSHGDSLGTGGGKGFAGPVLPILRGTKNVEWQAYLVRRAYDIILTAHYHTSANPGGGKLANGSVVGYGEFSNRIRAGFEVPQQWLALVHERWGLRERCEIKLEDPEPPALPRVRVPANFEKQS